jgi:hypothetical protein
MIYGMDFIKKNVVKAFTFPYCRFNCTTGVQGKSVFCPLFTGQQLNNNNKPNNIGGTR